jgi:hypothetical protein
MAEGSKGKEAESRLFYSKATGEDFIRQLTGLMDKNSDNLGTMLEKNNEDLKDSIERSMQTLSDNITASIAVLTAAILGRESATPPPPAPAPAPAPAPRPLTPPSVTTPDVNVTPPPEEEPERPKQQNPPKPSLAPSELPDPRYQPPQKHTMATLSPAPQRPLPIRELSVSPTPNQGLNSSSNDGRLPLSTLLPKFHGRDGENIVFWLHEMESLFVIYNVQEKNKVYNASRYVDSEAQKFYMYLITVNNGIAPT